MKLTEKLFGTHSSRELKRIMPLVDKIEALRPSMVELTDEQLKDKTREFKERLAKGETLDDLFPKHLPLFVKGIQTCSEYGTLPCTADRWYYSASGTYRGDENW